MSIQQKLLRGPWTCLCAVELLLNLIQESDCTAQLSFVCLFADSMGDSLIVSRVNRLLQSCKDKLPAEDFELVQLHRDRLIENQLMTAQAIGMCSVEMLQGYGFSPGAALALKAAFPSTIAAGEARLLSIQKHPASVVIALCMLGVLELQGVTCQWATNLCCSSFAATLCLPAHLQPEPVLYAIACDYLPSLNPPLISAFGVLGICCVQGYVPL